jgi:hypothetical protein
MTTITLPAPRAGKCRFLTCPDRGGDGLFGLFCAEHAALLGRMRRELETEPPRKYSIFGTRKDAYLDKEEG